MHRQPQIFFLVCFLFGVSSCSVVDDTLLTEEINDFARGVIALSGVITEEFALAEDVNTLGFTDNLQFQLELGGNPDTNLKPLFSAQDIAARRSLLAALDGYAETMAAVASGQSLSTLYGKLVGTSENLKSLEAGNFNLAHSLSFLDSSKLVNDISFFDELFVLPERDKRLLPIVEKGGESLKKTAILLYFDIGATADQSSKCSYTFPNKDLNVDMASLRLCKGGLRSIVSNAIAFDTNVWKDKLAYQKGSNSDNTKSRSATIGHLVQIQKLGQNLDQLLGDTQSALIAMIVAHDSISGTLTAASKTNLSSLAATSRNVLFHQKVSALVVAMANLNSALSDLTANSTNVQSLQVSNTGNSTVGESDDK